MIGETVSHYRILSRLGAGGMGVVYGAEDTRLGRKVAIKFVPDELLKDESATERFQREARFISSLNHPHICTLFDVGSHQGRPFMVMELLDGELLKDRIARGALPVDDVLELGAQLADALDAAHGQGIWHRDIKPSNLLITSRGSLKVLDFGIAKLNEAKLWNDLTATTGGPDQLTTMGTTVGTISYMSPEQARGSEIDARSDLFSAGVVLYEMATGRLPFQGATVAAIFESLLTKPPVAPSEVNANIPPELNRIILKAIEKEPAKRYQSAAELRTDLKRLKRAADSAGVAAPPSVGARHPSTVPWRKPVLIGAPLLTAIAVGGFFFYKSINTPALTQKDSVVLSSVVNRTGDAMFDDTLGEALALQLRQSPFLNVVPEQQVQATLRLMGREPMTPITAELGREICQRAGAKALLGGSIAMLGSSYVLTLNGQDCIEGNVIAEEQAQASSKETVLAAMGNAVSKFREKLGESLASIQRYDAKIEEATTPSLEALKAYSQGLRTRRTSGDFDSVPFFRRAIDLDNQFALAYARLGTVYANLGQPDESKKMTAKAYELREKVSEVERYYIEARYYTTVQTDVQKALDVYKVWLATYPQDYTALTNAALLHKQQGDRDEAIRKLELATKVAPDQPLAFTNLGQTYFEAAQYAEAKRAYESAILLQDSTSARVGLYQIAILMGDQPLADQQAAAVQGRRDEVDMIGIRMFAATYRGRMKEAAVLAEDYQARALALSRPQSASNAVMQLAISEAIVGLGDQARARIDKAEEDGILGDNVYNDRLVVAALMKDAATAKELFAKALEEQTEKAQPGAGPSEAEKAVHALVKLAEGKAAEAAAMLEPVSFRASLTDLVNIWSVAKMQAGDFASAEQGLTFMISREARNNLSAAAPWVHLALGRVQVQTGNKVEARKNYRKFFEMFKDADPDLPLLVEARDEFAKLGS
ncbi:MAG: protein kinase [Cyanobacteria bacterium]|nr:protein kinase [Cyanobacteriota bacterium]